MFGIQLQMKQWLMTDCIDGQQSWLANSIIKMYSWESTIEEFVGLIVWPNSRVGLLILLLKERLVMYRLIVASKQLKQIAE